MEVKTVVSLHYGDSEIRVPLLLMYAAQPKVQFVSVDYGGLPPKELKVSPALSEDVKRLYQHLGSAAEEVELIVKKGPNGIHLDSLKTTNLPNRSNAHTKLNTLLSQSRQPLAEMNGTSTTFTPDQTATILQQISQERSHYDVRDFTYDIPGR